MSGEALPGHLDLYRLAEQNAVLGGRMPTRAMQRLAAALASDEGEAEAELAFALDPVRRPVITGHVRSEVTLECQRCLEPFRQPLDVSFRLVRVRSEGEGEHLPEDYEPLLTDQEQIRTAELLEDELILALPVVAMHAEGAGCRLQSEQQPPSSESAEARRPNAFAALAALKRKNE